LKKNNCLLWRIETTFPQDSWLFGTMHIKDAKAFGLLDTLYQKIDHCEAFATELNIDEMKSGGADLIQTPSVPPLYDLLPAHYYHKLKRILKKALRIDLDQWANWHPMIISKIISEAMMASEMPVFLDDQLWSYAKAAEKKLMGIETLEEQLSVFDGISLDEHLDYLRSLAKNYTRTRKKQIRILDLYAKGDLRQLHKAALKGAGNKELMVYRRNRIMAERIDDLIRENGTLFCAIGAGHLWGERGVLRALKHKGYRLRPFS
jgi:uncharacterized protein YbaP (TraB family)